MLGLGSLRAGTISFNKKRIASKASSVAFVREKISMPSLKRIPITT